MRLGIAEVHQESITQMLRDRALIAFDNSGTGLLVGTDYLVQVFGIESRRERSGVHQIAKHHRELPPLSFGDSRTRHRSLWSLGFAPLVFLRSGPSLLLARFRRRGERAA